MQTILIRLIAATLALAITPPALAEWHEASSDHFVIYADDNEADIRKFAENLERYHAAMAHSLGRKADKPSPSSRVTIYVVGDQSDIRKLAGVESRLLAGFYIPRAGGSRAFVQDIRKTQGDTDVSTIVLLHEYAHHFLVTATPYAMPHWMNEGAAEFFAAAVFLDDGSVLIGRPAQHRWRELIIGDLVHVRELLKSDGRKQGSPGFYARSWLLYHYLTFSEKRKGQLEQYQRNLAAGMDSLAAGEAAFGDLEPLDRELRPYIRAKGWVTRGLKPDKIPINGITMRQLRPGEAAIMPLQIRSHRGVNQEEAIALLPQVRAVAARFPEDPGVLAALAEAEYNAGNDAETIAAADGAIARDPARVNAYVQKGLALFRQAGKTQEKETAFTAAMQPFEALNAIENDHPLPLMYYYRSFAERDAPPPENARAALLRASELAPFDLQLQFNTATMLVRDGKIDLAYAYLGPLSANPHAGGMGEAARQIREQLAGLPAGTRIDPGALSGGAPGGDEAGQDASALANPAPAPAPTAPDD